MNPKGISPVALGATGLMASPVGFGCYRVAPGAPEHRAALVQALTSGVNLIDLSANYADGGAEILAGRVLAELIQDGRIRRRDVVVLTKAGYLQGRNFQLSQRRKSRGDPFPDLVEFAPGLEHCIHPEFLEDQLDRSLERLGLEAVDAYLLHNPEYYPAWAAKQGLDRTEARVEYRRRLEAAFRHLEDEVRRGRIGCYGVSSNTFPAPAADFEFTCLEELWDIAQGISASHHFRVVQFPCNLLETGAVTEKNQPSGLSLLEAARSRNLAVLINRPLNAVSGDRLIRLAEPETDAPPPDQAIRELLLDLAQSEDLLVSKLLPNLHLEPTMERETAERIRASRMLLGSWSDLSGLEHWRGVEGMITARVNAAFMLLADRLRDSLEGVSALDAHLKKLGLAFKALGDWYGLRAREEARSLGERLARLVPEWADEKLSRAAVRALCSTRGVSCVLAGMRRPEYVTDLLAALEGLPERADRTAQWERVGRELAKGREHG